MTMQSEIRAELAAERYWIEKRDEGLPFVIMKAALAAYFMEHKKIRAEAKEKYIANCVSKFGQENLEEILKLRLSYISQWEKEIQKDEIFLSNAIEKSIEALENGLKKKLEKPRTRANYAGASSDKVIWELDD